MTDNQKNASIEYILAHGFVKPPTFWQRASNMHGALGWKCIFWDLSYSMIFVTVTLFVTAFLLYFMPISYYQYSVAVGFSPVLFVLIVLLAEINERACGLYELKQTCHYTSRQITALRCIYYSVAGVVFAVAVTAFSSASTACFFRILPLCLGGLFLCATAELSVIRLTLSKWAVAICSAVWLIINLALPILLGQRWEAFLSSLPLVFTIAFMIAGAAVFLHQTNKMLMEENRYAAA